MFYPNTLIWFYCLHRPFDKEICKFTRSNAGMKTFAQVYWIMVNGEFYSFVQSHWTSIFLFEFFILDLYCSGESTLQLSFEYILLQNHYNTVVALKNN